MQYISSVGLLWGITQEQGPSKENRPRVKFSLITEWKGYQEQSYM